MKNCSCQGCTKTDCICAGLLDAEARANCDGEKNCSQNGCTYALKQVQSRNRMAQPEFDVGRMASVTLIPANEIHPHPDNPRKDLGDLTELADSIKANGILQNLTVVPRVVTGEITGRTWQDGYTVVIGHRRLAAAKLAGLKELPCIVSDMGLRDQVRTMLMENIQRADLTIYEQAQGFQMMMDMGDTVEEIARKSGFSQSTVRRRVKLLALDQEKLKASVERGANLVDYMELDKIEDPALKNEVLDAIGTNNFRQRLASAIQTEKTRKFVAERAAEVSQWATQIEGADWQKYTYVRNYGLWSWKKDSVVERPADADTVQYYYCIGREQVDIYKEKAEPDEDAAAQTRRVQEQEAYEKRKANLATASLRAFNLRREFVAGISNGQAKALLHDILRLAGQVCFMAEDGSADLDQSLLAGLLEISVDLENDAFPMDVYKAEMDHCPEYTLLATLYASIDSDRMEYWGSRWDMENHRSVLVHEENKALDFVYDTLETFGYQMSDEEAALQDGTHELFQDEPID